MEEEEAERKIAEQMKIFKVGLRSLLTKYLKTQNLVFK